MDSSICRLGVNMRELLETINEEPAGIAFVEDENRVLRGVVTDGDFRRMLLAGAVLDDTLDENDLHEFVYAYQGDDVEELMKKINRRVRVIPILDREKRVVDYFRFDHRVRMIPVAEPDLKGNEFNYLTDALLSTWISSSGKYIDRLESEFAEYCESPHGVAVASGTVALHLALTALGIGEGDEVIVPDLTFAASANSVLHAHAVPVLVDIEKDGWCIDPAEIEKAVTPRTKAIMPVHIYGQPCDMDPIMEIARKHDLKVVEDAAEAHGAEYKGRKVGSFGDIACFSFFGNKIITTGEGGICTTASDELNERMRSLRDHGMSKTKRYWHDQVGFNYRMTNMQAAIGCAQLERIEEILDGRRAIENSYREILDDLDLLEWQRDLPDRKRVTWLVAVLLKAGDRDDVLVRLKELGIDVRPFFYPLSEMPIYRPYIFSNANTKALARRGLNLPTIQSIDFKRIRAAFDKIAAEV